MSERVPADHVASTWLRPFDKTQLIPDAADAVLMGGGKIGVSTAWILAKQGVSVIRIESNQICIMLGLARKK